MEPKEIQYEVLVEDKGKWTIRYQTPSEFDAFNQAHSLMRDEKVGGIKINLETSIYGSDRFLSKTIFTKTTESTAGMPIQISGAVETADLCSTPEDLMQWSARYVMNRLFRDYLDFAMVTPTEILSNYGHFKNIEAAGPIIFAAIGSVTIAQNRKMGEDQVGNRKTLENLVEATKKHISATEGKGDLVTLIKPGMINDYVATLRDVNASQFIKNSYICASITRTLRTASVSGWAGKLEALVDLLPEGEVPSADIARLFDRYISDIFYGSQAIKEILGGQTSMGEAIMTMIHLSTGKLEIKKYHPPCLARVNELFGYGQMHITEEVLKERIRSELCSNKPLTKDTIDKEIATLDAIVAAQSDGMRFDADIQAAIVQRSKEQIPEEISRIFGIASDPISRIERLLDLQTSTHGEDGTSIIVQKITSLLDVLEPVERALEKHGAPMEQMRHLTKLQQGIASLDVLDSEKEESLTKLDEVCFGLMRTNQIIPKVEAGAKTKPQIVDKLLLLGKSNTLTEGKCLSALRQRIVSFTKTPNFIKDYLSDCPTPEAQTKKLAAFRQMLQDVGVV